MMGGDGDLMSQLIALTGAGTTPEQYTQQNQQIEQGNQSLQMGRMQLAAATQQEQQQQQYSSDVSDWISRGSPPAELPALAIKYPQQYQAIKAGWDLKDKAQQTADLNFFGQAYAAANNGRTDLAKQQLVARRDAEKQAGIDTSELDDLIGQFDTDPKAAANTLKSVALAHIYAGDKDGFAKAFGLGSEKTHVLTAGGALVDDTGKVLYHADEKPTYQKVDVLDANGTKIGERIIQLGGGDGGSPSDGSGAPRSVRNNNPGNIEDGQFAKSQPGYQGSDGRFAQFDSPESGAAAQTALLSQYGAQGRNTVAKIVSKWAPASDGNNVGAYAKFVAQKLGVHPNQALDMTDPKTLSGLQMAMAAFEGGSQSKSNGPATAATASGGANVGGRAVYDTTPPGAEAGTAKVPANVDTLAHALVTGQQALPSSFALAKPFWQSVLTRAYQIDPQFDSSKQPARVAAVKAFTGNGKAAQTIGSVNRIANHLSDMYDASEQLVGPNLGNTSVNHLAASIGQSFQPAALRKYNTAVPLVADELEKIARNSSGSVHGIEAAIANLKAAQSTDERRAAIQEVVSLIHGAVGPLQTQWSDAFTAGIKPPTWVGSKARAVFAHLAPQLDESDIENPAAPAGKPSAAPRSAGSPSTSPAAGIPVHIATMAQAMALPSGTKFVDPHGVTRVRP